MNSFYENLFLRFLFSIITIFEKGYSETFTTVLKAYRKKSFEDTVMIPVGDNALKNDNIDVNIQVFDTDGGIANRYLTLSVSEVMNQDINIEFDDYVYI